MCKGVAHHHAGLTAGEEVHYWGHCCRLFAGGALVCRLNIRSKLETGLCIGFWVFAFRFFQ